MSGTSEYAGIIRRASGYPTDYAPVDPIVGRDIVVNSVNHVADVNGQSRVNWITTAGGTPVTATVSANLAWQPVWYAPAFPASLMPNGDAYRWRVRIAGCGENASFDVRFAVTLRTPGIGQYPATTATDSVWLSAIVNSTSPAWLTGSSAGPEAWPNMLELPAALIAPMMRNTATLADVSGAPLGVQQCLVQPTVWAYVEDTAHQAILHGVSIEEWPG